MNYLFATISPAIVLGVIGDLCSILLLALVLKIVWTAGAPEDKEDE